MNSKKCKKMRRDAETLTVGLPALAYETKGVHPNKRSQYTHADCRRVSLNCTRGIYRKLKRELKAQEARA